MANYPGWHRPAGTDPLYEGADDIRRLGDDVDAEMKRVDGKLPALSDVQTESGLNAAHETRFVRSTRNWGADRSNYYWDQKIVGCFAACTLDADSRGYLALLSGVFTTKVQSVVVTPYGQATWAGSGAEKSWFTVGVLHWSTTHVAIEARALNLWGVYVDGIKFSAGSQVSRYMVAAGN